MGWKVESGGLGPAADSTYTTTYLVGALRHPTIVNSNLLWRYVWQSRRTEHILLNNNLKFSTILKYDTSFMVDCMLNERKESLYHVYCSSLITVDAK